MLPGTRSEMRRAPSAAAREFNNWEIGFVKSTPIGERYKIEFRGELFNAFNHAQFFQPDGNFTDGTDFGRVKRARDPRLIQFALKFYF